MQTPIDFSRLYQVLDYQFNSPDLLQEAITHRSAGSKNNERLEFLGDSILNFVIAEELFKRYPNDQEGDLSRSRALLVKKEGLARVARDMDLSRFLILGSGELKSGGYRRDSILADTVEAIFGAVYLDSDFDQVKQLILRLYRNQLDNMPDLATLKDGKTRLQELLQSRKYPLPVYEVIDVIGKSHNQTFTVNCFIESLAITTEGKGSSRRKAEQQAAEAAIAVVEKRFATSS